VDLLEALLLAACFAVIEILVSSFQIPHFEVTIESLIHVLIRNDPRKENRIFIRCFILKTFSIFLHWDMALSHGGKKVSIPRLNATSNPTSHFLTNSSLLHLIISKLKFQTMIDKVKCFNLLFNHFLSLIFMFSHFHAVIFMFSNNVLLSVLFIRYI